MLESAPVSGSEEFVVVGLDSIDNRLYIVTVDAEENLRSIAWAESLEEAVALVDAKAATGGKGGRARAKAAPNGP